jgi:UPF0755 protein
MKKRSGAARVLLCTVFILFCLALALAGGSLAAYRRFNAPPDGEPRQVFFEVKAGESARSIGEALARSGYIKSSAFWYIITRIDGIINPAHSVKAGQYALKLPASSRELLALLQDGREELVRITIPEGWTISKIAALLDEAGICESGAFRSAAASPVLLETYTINGSTMEGYLYPDTYLFPVSCPAEKVLQTLLGTFFIRFDAFCAELGIDRAALSREEINETVLLASIVEREYRVSSEAPVMAGVFRNRLRIGMALESCATVEYIITEIQGRPHPSRLLTADTRIESPYNTYLHRGFPPAPISCPGEVALKAVLAPAQTPYLFFRVKGDGTHYFSETFDDHIKAGELVLKQG